MLNISSSFLSTRMTTPELRWNLGYGYLRLRLPSETDAIKVLVLLRGCNSGFCYIAGGDGIMWAKTLEGQVAAKKLLQKVGYCDPRQL